MRNEELKQLTKYSVKRQAPADYSLDNVNQAIIDGFKELGGSYNKFMHNRHLIYEIIAEAVDEVVPRNVTNALAPFADIQVVPQGQRVVFRVRAGRLRARKFLTQVGLSGVYDTFRLDSNTFEVTAQAVGGGATLDFERMLDGAEDLAEYAEVVAQGLTDATYGMVQAALRAALNAKGRPAATYHVDNTFKAEEMVKIINVVRAYGNGAVIFAPPEFVAAMGPDAIVPGTDAYHGVYSPDDIEAIHRTGYIYMFRGCPVVQIPQSYTDEHATTTWIDPQVAYVLPTGGEKVVKVVMEGPTVMDDFRNRDRSMEIQAYKKIGAAILTNYNWGIYQNTGIEQTFTQPYGY